MTCLGVGVSIFSMNLPAVLKRGPYLLLISSSVNFTSSEVTGLPSCHFASTRSKRYVVPSFEISHDLARLGAISNPVLKRTSPSYSRQAAPTSGTELVVSGERLSGSVPSTRTAVPPRLGPGACATAGTLKATRAATTAQIGRIFINFMGSPK